jgi:hypothetical protein
MRWTSEPKDRVGKRYYWNPEFAWWPRKLENKQQFVWLERVWAHHDYYGADGSVAVQSRYRDDVGENNRNLALAAPK